CYLSMSPRLAPQEQEQHRGEVSGDFDGGGARTIGTHGLRRQRRGTQTHPRPHPAVGRHLPGQRPDRPGHRRGPRRRAAHRRARPQTPGYRGLRRRVGSQAPTAPARQGQDQGHRRAEVGPTGLQRPARGPLPLDLAAAGRRVGGVRPGRFHQHRDRPPGPSKNDIQPWIVETWCIPPEADAEYVWRMEDVIATYLLPYDPAYPVVCFDEACKQLFGEVRDPLPALPGSPAKRDYEYERKGVCNQLMMCEPLRGWRHVRVSERRTRKDYAQCLRELVQEHYPEAKKIRLVQDNLNTHDGASLYEAFRPEVARSILERIEWHYTPKHGSWLNMAETEIRIMNGQCLDRRMESQDRIAREVAAWERKRNAQQARIHWTFTIAAARRKLHKLYPSIED